MDINRDYRKRLNWRVKIATYDVEDLQLIDLCFPTNGQRLGHQIDAWRLKSPYPSL